MRLSAVECCSPWRNTAILSRRRVCSDGFTLSSWQVCIQGFLTGVSEHNIFKLDCAIYIGLDPRIKKVIPVKLLGYEWNHKQDVWCLGAWIPGPPPKLGIPRPMFLDFAEATRIRIDLVDSRNASNLPWPDHAALSVLFALMEGRWRMSLYIGSLVEP